MRRFLAVAICTLMCAIAFLGPSVTGAYGQTSTSSTTLLELTQAQADAQVKSVIPRPNSGTKPTQIGDRGALGQAAVLLFILAVLATVTTVVVRSTIRNGRVRDANGAENNGDPRRS